MSEYEIILKIRPKRTLSLQLDVQLTFKEVSEFLIDEHLIPPNQLVAYYGIRSKKLSENQWKCCLQQFRNKMILFKCLQEKKYNNSKLNSQFKYCLNNLRTSLHSSRISLQFDTILVIIGSTKSAQQQPSPSSNQNESQDQITIYIEIQDGSQCAKIAVHTSKSNTLNDLNNIILKNRGIENSDVVQADFYISGIPYMGHPKRERTLKQLQINNEQTIVAKIRWSGGSMK